MGKTFRKEKTLDRQRKKLNRNRRGPRLPRTDPLDIEGDTYVQEDLSTEEELRQQGNPQPPSKEDN
jgi:hypothetical protein